MIRMLAFATLAAALPASHCGDLIVGDASRPDPHSQKYIERLATAAKTRFVAAANASGCRREASLYAFKILRDRLPGSGQAILDDAAARGMAEGRSVADDAGSTACRAAIEKLNNADDQLLVLSDQVPGSR